MDTAVQGSDWLAARVNGQKINLNDPQVVCRQLLGEAGYNPADEHVLIRQLANGTRVVGLDDLIDLRPDGIEEFWAFRADRTFQFTVDNRGYVWGEGAIKEPCLRQITHTPEDNILLLEREDEPDRILGPDDEVRLDMRGTEHFRTVSRLITVYFNQDEKRIPRGVYTTEQLSATLGVEPGYVLNVLDEHGQLRPLAPCEHLRVVENMQFFSQAPCGGAS